VCNWATARRWLSVSSTQYVQLHYFNSDIVVAGIDDGELVR
jgi:hypothetical protein